MTITLDRLGKKYHREWVFKALSYQFRPGEHYAITGPNGSGKSTLIQLIAGVLLPSRGSIAYSIGNNQVSSSDIFRHLSIATPYLEFIEELTLLEFLNFHFQFKKLKLGTTISDIIDIMYLKDAENKPIKYFSSGMKQRLKLGLCFFAQSEVILLDEPTNNLDKKGTEWYKTNISQIRDQLVIIASNQKSEYKHCNHIISIENYG